MKSMETITKGLPVTWPMAVPEGLESEERPWGRWTILYEAAGMKVKLIEVRSGHRLSLQYHHYRSELWICVAGRPSAQVGDDTLVLDPFGSVRIPVGAIHRLGNAGSVPACIVEVQQGEDLSEEDIVRLEDDYHRAVRGAGF
jgi:mannose-6-phosphate isomerase-like protein (cupin superfamily)